MNAKEFLANKGVHSLDTKKRYNEVIDWMEEYAILRQTTVSGRSEQSPPPNCSKCGRSGYSTGTPFCTDDFCNGGNFY